MPQKLLALCLVLIFTITLHSQNNQQKTNSQWLIKNANVVDVLSGKILKNRNILIENNKIIAISKKNKNYANVPASNQIDASNKYVIPGLWDNHIHIEGENLVEDNLALFPVYLAYGITTVRDCASDLGEQVLSWRDQINNGSLLGPTIFTAGRKLEGVNSIWKGDLEIGNEAELHSMLDKLDKYKVDFIKITESTLDGSLYTKSVLAAHNRGYLVSGHIPSNVSIETLIDNGLSSIEHASYVLRLGSDENEMISKLNSKEITRGQAEQLYYKNFNQEKAISNYKKLAKKSMTVTPTLIGGKQLAYLDENNHQNDTYLQYLTKRFTDNYQWRIGRMAGETAEQKQLKKDKYKRIAKQVPLMQKAGVTILAGSDSAALNTFVYPAAALIEELELFQNEGMTPKDILKTATINGAKFLKKSDIMGSLNEGKIADLVILNENPLMDIKAVKQIYSVFTKGHYFDRETLNSMLETAKNKKIELDEKRK
jgi:imidazolonepropionase-like amidohydrolase